MKATIRVAMVAAAVAAGSGCRAFLARTTDVPVEETRHYTQRYDYADMRRISEEVARELIESPVLAREPEPPVMMIAGIENRTSQYVDTKNLSDRIRLLTFQSGRVRYVNEARREELMREQGYQAANVTREQQVAIGQQLGARYMITGSLAEMSQSSPRQVRLSRRKLNYYKLTVELTNLTTGEIVWMTEKEFAREASLPLIGW